MEIVCLNCGKKFAGRKESKYCCKQCANAGKLGVSHALRVVKRCEWCGAEFMISANNKRGKRFCSPRCSAFWRNATYGPNLISEETKRKNAERLKAMWASPEFRESNFIRMTTNNPSFTAESVEKCKLTKLQRGYVPKNNFKYGNGKISYHEQLVYDLLLKNGYYYNYPIDTKLARDAFPEQRYANRYKPDFVNLREKICIEIDGANHTKKSQRILDKKKEACLQFLGFTTIRFTHTQVENHAVEDFINGKINS